MIRRDVMFAYRRYEAARRVLDALYRGVVAEGQSKRVLLALRQVLRLTFAAIVGIFLLLFMAFRSIR